MPQWAWGPSLPGGRTTEVRKCLLTQQRAFLLSASYPGAAQVSGILLSAVQGVFGKCKTRCRCLETPTAVMAGHPSSCPSCLSRMCTPDRHSCSSRARLWVGRSRELQRCPAHTSHPPATPLLETRGDPNAKAAEQEIKRPLNPSRQGRQWAMPTQFHDVNPTSHTQKPGPVFALTEYLQKAFPAF